VIGQEVVIVIALEL